MKTFKIIASAVIILSVLISILFFLKNQSELKRKLDNLEQIQSDYNSKVLVYTKKEFRKDSLLKSIIDSLNIKIRHIESVTHNEYSYTYDTIKTVLIHQKNNIKSFRKTFDSCLTVSGKVIQDTIIFDKVKINYNSSTVYFWNREKKFLFFRFGRKKHYARTINNCSGETKTEEIKIVKKRLFKNKLK